jgi:hypothetical protein
MSFFTWGVDLGQSVDYTAVVVVEAFPTWRKIGREAVPDLPITSLVCRKVDRFPLRTSYQDIARIIGERIQSELAKKRETFLVLDHTGVGRAAAEMFRDSAPLLITITGGNEVQPGAFGNELRVPKRDLIAAAQVPLQNGTLKIIRDKDKRMAAMTDTLTSELTSFTVKISDNGRDVYNGREGVHDDLVLACALACWAAGHIVQLKCRTAVAEIERQMWQARLAGSNSDGSISQI